MSNAALWSNQTNGKGHFSQQPLKGVSQTALAFPRPHKLDVTSGVSPLVIPQYVLSLNRANEAWDGHGGTRCNKIDNGDWSPVLVLAPPGTLRDRAYPKSMSQNHGAWGEDLQVWRPHPQEDWLSFFSLPEMAFIFTKLGALNLAAAAWLGR